MAFAARFGEISVHPYVPSIEGYPGLMRISEPTPVTTTWHADTTHLAAPPALTLLLARVIPPYGGDTMFANQYLAYENLSPGLRATLDSLRAVHQGTELRRRGRARDRRRHRGPPRRAHPPRDRPALVVRQRQLHEPDRRVDRGRERPAARGSSTSRAAGPSTRGATAGSPATSSSGTTAARSTPSWPTSAAAERVLHRVTIAGDVPA